MPTTNTTARPKAQNHKQSRPPNQQQASSADTPPHPALSPGGGEEWLPRTHCPSPRHTRQRLLPLLQREKKGPVAEPQWVDEGPAVRPHAHPSPWGRLSLPWHRQKRPAVRARERGKRQSNRTYPFPISECAIDPTKQIAFMAEENAV